jgi:hypothetical protein
LVREWVVRSLRQRLPSPRFEGSLSQFDFMAGPDHNGLVQSPHHTTISNPGWYDVQLTGINDAAQMVVYYEDTQAVWHGFIATPN